MPKTLEDLLAAQPTPVVSWYAITAHRRIQHPGIAVVLAAGRERLAL